MSWINTIKTTLMFRMFPVFDLNHKIVFLSRSVFCVCYRKHILLKENLLIALPLMLRAIWTRLVSSVPITRNVSLSRQQPPWGQATGDGHSRWSSARRWSPTPHQPPLPTPHPISQQRFHMSRACISNFSRALAEDNATQLNRWCHNYIWYCTVITCHLSMRMCEEHFWNDSLCHDTHRLH